MTQMHTTWREVDISAYVDGALEPTQQAAFETALAQDRALQQKVREMREVVALVRALPLREPPRNYLLTPSMVAEKSAAEKSAQRPQRRPTPLLFMRLATSLAAVAFVVTAGLTYMQRGISPTMVMQAPKAAEEMPAMEAPQAVVVATVEVSKEVEIMQASQPAAMSAATATVEEVARAEKVVESEAVVEAPAPAPLAATPQPEMAGAAAADATTNAQELEEAAPQEEMLALEAAPGTEAQVVDETARVVEDSTGTPSDAGEREGMAYDTTEPTADQYGQVAVASTPTPSWWLPAILGAVTLLLAGITYWVSRRR